MPGVGYIITKLDRLGREPIDVSRTVADFEKSRHLQLAKASLVKPRSEIRIALARRTLFSRRPISIGYSGLENIVDACGVARLGRTAANA